MAFLSRLAPVSSCGSLASGSASGWKSPISRDARNASNKARGSGSSAPQAAFSESGPVARITARREPKNEGAAHEHGGPDMARWLRVALGSLTVLAVIAAPVGLALHQQAHVRNFRVVRPGVLYRSGQMTLQGLERVVNDYHIRTVISLRGVSELSNGRSGPENGNPRRAGPGGVADRLQWAGQASLALLRRRRFLRGRCRRCWSRRDSS